MVRFVKNPQRDQYKGDRVDQRDQDADTMIAVGFVFVGGTRRDADGKPTQTERNDIGQVVRRVGKQGEAVAEDASEKNVYFAFR